MVLRVQLTTYLQGVKETPLYIYYKYLKGDHLHTKHVNRY